jgi:hypothetical protein
VNATTEKLQQSKRAMLDQEEIDDQQKLLETHRRTLSHYIKVLDLTADPKLRQQVQGQLKVLGAQ